MRRYLQFSLRTLLLAVTVFAVCLGVLCREARIQEDIRARVQVLGGRADYFHELEHYGSCFYRPASTPNPRRLAWLTDFIGRDFFYRVFMVNLDGTNAADEDLEAISRLRGIQRIRLVGTRVTIDGVCQFQREHPDCRIAWDWTEERIDAINALPK